jgi:hypothetical protein
LEIEWRVAHDAPPAESDQRTRAAELGRSFAPLAPAVSVPFGLTVSLPFARVVSALTLTVSRAPVRGASAAKAAVARRLMAVAVASDLINIKISKIRFLMMFQGGTSKRYGEIYERFPNEIVAYSYQDDSEFWIIQIQIIANQRF